MTYPKKQFTCGDCCHLKKAEVDKTTLKAGHYCRRYPKTLVLQMVEGGAVATMTGNPPETPEAPACGEFRSKSEGLLS
jgi:hypothetical protein